MNRFFSSQSTQHHSTTARHADGSAASPSPWQTPNRPANRRSSGLGQWLAVGIGTLLAALSWPAASPAQEVGKARTVEIYARVLGDSSQDIALRIKMCRQLAELGSEASAAVPALLQALDYRGRHVVSCLVYRGSGVRVMLSPETNIQQFTAGKTDVFATDDGRRQDLLEEDHGLLLRSEAARALRLIRPPAEHIIPRVAKVLERTPEESWSLKSAIEQREEWVSRHGGFKRTFVSLEPLCVELIDLLAEYGPEAGDAVPVLLKAAEGKLRTTAGQPDSFTYSIGPHQTIGRKHAIEALGRIGSETAVELLEEIALLTDDSPSLKMAAQEALSQIQRQGRE